MTKEEIAMRMSRALPALLLCLVSSSAVAVVPPTGPIPTEVVDLARTLEEIRLIFSPKSGTTEDYVWMVLRGGKTGTELPVDRLRRVPNGLLCAWVELLDMAAMGLQTRLRASGVSIAKLDNARFTLDTLRHAHCRGPGGDAANEELSRFADKLQGAINRTDPKLHRYAPTAGEALASCTPDGCVDSDGARQFAGRLTPKTWGALALFLALALTPLPGDEALAVPLLESAL